MRKWIFSGRGLVFGGIATILLLVILIVCVVVLPNRFPPGTILVPRDVATLQEALEKIQPGKRIVLDARDSPFLGPVRIDTPGISIFSVGGTALLQQEGDEPTITVATNDVSLRDLVVEAGDVGIALEEASGCIVERVSVEGARLGIELRGCVGNRFADLSLQGCEIGMEIISSGRNHVQGVHIERIAGVGLKLSDSWQNRIEGISVINAQVGLTLEQNSMENEIVSCLFDRCTTGAVEIWESTGNAVSKNTIMRCPIGVALHTATKNRIHGNSISNCSSYGMDLYKSERNTLTGNTLSECRESGVVLRESKENTLSFNTVSRCDGSGITLERVEATLLFSNSIEENAVGLLGVAADYNRFLRNTIRRNTTAAMILTHGNGNLLSDNLVSDSQFGLALIGSTGNHLLRNTVESCTKEGISLINTSQRNTLVANLIRDNDVGFLLASSGQNTVSENSIRDNRIGLRLFLSSSGTLIDGNLIEHNYIGLLIDAELNNKDTILGDLEGELVLGEDEITSVVITNNFLAENELYNLWNNTEETIFAGGNWWEDPSLVSGAQAEKVSDGVVVPTSAWKGTVAVGTTDALEEVVLGRLIQLILRSKGFKVVDLIGLGNEDELRDALRLGDAHLIWGDPGMLDSEELGRGEFHALPPIPAQRTLAVLVSEDLAGKLASATTSALSTWVAESRERVVFAVPTEVTRKEWQSFATAYEMPITAENVFWTTGLGQTEVVLKLGRAQAAIIKSFVGGGHIAGFTLLVDDRGLFPTSQIGLIAGPGLSEEHPEIAGFGTALSSVLTSKTLQALVSRVRFLGRDPSQVARQFLLQEGLITW